MITAEIPKLKFSLVQRLKILFAPEITFKLKVKRLHIHNSKESGGQE